MARVGLTHVLNQHAPAREHGHEPGNNSLQQRFFAWRPGAVAFAEILLLALLSATTVAAFRRCSHAAAWLLLPYLAWVAFAAALNAALWQATQPCRAEPGRRRDAAPDFQRRLRRRTSDNAASAVAPSGQPAGSGTCCAPALPIVRLSIANWPPVVVPPEEVAVKSSTNEPFQPALQKLPVRVVAVNAASRMTFQSEKPVER